MAKRASLRTLAATLAGTMPAFTLTVAPAAASTPAAPTYTSVKAALDGDHALTKTVVVLGDTRTTTYTNHTGGKISTAEPVGVRSLSVHRDLSVGGCGWFTFCVWFNRSDQFLLEAGAVGFLGAVICAIAVPLCPFASAAAGAAGVFLSTHALCHSYLVETLFPWPGSFRGCY